MRRSSPRNPLRFETLESREVPSANVLVSESFDASSPGTNPQGWVQWSSTGTPSFAASNLKASSGTMSLAGNGASNTTARYWRDVEFASDTSVAASILVDSLVPTQLIARGKNLNTSNPTYYALSVSRGMTVDLLRVVNGQSTLLASVATSGWFSQQWIRATLFVEGGQLLAQIQRADTGQFLSNTGTWQSSEAFALVVSDTAIVGGGNVGINRQARFAGTVYFDDLTILGKGQYRETFETTALGSLPSGWQQSTSSGTVFGVTNMRAYSQTQSLGTSVQTSQQSGRVWRTETVPANTELEATIYADSLVPVQMLLRGSKLDSTQPNYYGVTIQRGLTLSLTRTIDGVSTTIGSLQSRTYLSGRWIDVTFTSDNDRLRVLVQRLDNGLYLNTNGEWQATPTFALEARDTSIQGGGNVGFARLGGYTGTVTIDDFRIGSSNADTIPPTVAITSPNIGSPVSGIVTVRGVASDVGGITKVEFLINGVKRAESIGAPPYEWTFDSRNEANGNYTLTVRAFDAEGNVGTASQSMVIDNLAEQSPRPEIPRKYSHIRIAQLAYYGTPMGAFEKTLLERSVDLVIPNVRYLETIDTVAPNTPQLIYSNVSNLYFGLLSEWLNWADSNQVSRELAFYHVTNATAWSGSSPSSQPVTWFWNVERGSANPTNWSTGFTDLTSQSRSTMEGINLGSAGTATYIGYLDKFREVNFVLGRAAASGWSAVLEYPSAVGANGQPTAWKTLTLRGNTTNQWQTAGALTFDPPADWVTSSIGGSQLMYHIRLRVTAGTEAQAPLTWRILGRDYVQANGGNSGVIPAFDRSADRDGDGYLNDAEFANRRSGFEARFEYESRLFYPSYGQMRFVTNPSSIAVQAFLGEYHKQFLDSYPLADGLFVDNSGGKIPFSNIAVLESTANYSTDYGAALSAINRMIAPRWVMANTVGGGVAAEAVVAQVPSTIEEFLIRPLAATWANFNDIANLVKRRQALANPAPYLVLDSMPTGGSPTDPRTQLATLAYYYLIGNPETTFLMFYGGFETSTTWSRHWSQAAAYDVGLPIAEWKEFASGLDPANNKLTYKVLSREYSNALVLYKPLSYTLREGTGTTADNTATTHQLNGSYRVLRSDGTLSPSTVTSITLRNGEGAILIKA